MSWRDSEIQGWSNSCAEKCLRWKCVLIGTEDELRRFGCGVVDGWWIAGGRFFLWVGSDGGGV